MTRRLAPAVTTSIALPVRVAIGAVLLWQAVAVLDRTGRDLANGLEMGVVGAFTENTDERLRRVMGDMVEPLVQMRSLFRDGDIVTGRLDATSLPELRRTVADERDLAAAVRRIEQRNAVFNTFAALASPRPWFVRVPQPVAAVESGRCGWLLVLGDDPEPTDRPGWSRSFRCQLFTIWQWQKG